MSFVYATCILEKDIFLLFKEKASWQAAVNHCRSYGRDWVLPPLDNQYDINVVNEGMQKRNWKSVWTGIKREIFDAYYWEDGSFGSNLKGKNHVGYVEHVIC